MTGWTRLHKITIWDASDCKRGGGNGGFRLKAVRVYKQSVLQGGFSVNAATEGAGQADSKESGVETARLPDYQRG